MKITDKLIRSSCSPMIYKRGMEYFKEGRVHLKKREENRITALVDDENIYSVEVEFDEDKVNNCFCTCAYYQTMRTACKHIVATLSQRMTEVINDGNFEDENDKIANALCNVFINEEMPKTKLYARFILTINKGANGVGEYGMSIEIDGVNGKLDGIENFLEAYAKGKEFKIDKNIIYNPSTTEFPKLQGEILSILSESYLNRSANVSMYTKAIYTTSFGSKTAMRILPYINRTDITVIFDGLKCNDLQVVEENPDILIDVMATEKDILLSLGERGFALTDNGEWFMYDGVIYHTNTDWQSYYMPIYRALLTDNRLQLTFKGNNTILFAKHILPKLSKRQGVIMQGIDELIVNEIPEFDVYFDAINKKITAVIIVRYGSILIHLPQTDLNSDKIVIRNEKMEAEVLSYFSSFSRTEKAFELDKDYGIFDFIKHKVDELLDIANVKCSDSFMRLMNTDDIKISAFVGYNKDTDLLEASIDTDLSTEEICRILSAIQLKKPFYRLSDGRFLDLENDDNVFKTLTELNFTEDDINNQIKEISKNYTLYLEHKKSIKKSKTFNSFIKSIRDVKPEIPSDLDTVLRDYQKVGITWLKQLSKLSLGGILADDMGLGKTLQVLAYAYGEKPKTPTLIVTPSALMYNWLNEINRFIPKAKTLIIDGNKENRTELLTRIYEFDFIITSYPLLRRDIAEYKDIEFEYFFIDEAQHIKNPHTMSSYAVKRINAEKRFAITGTPIENSLSELWSIFDFIMPEYLYSLREFRERYEYPISRENDETVASELKSKIKPFIMRRMKKDVLKELPEKIEETIYAELSEAQKNMYTSFLAVAKDETLSLLYDGGQGRMRILTLLMRLRQICAHPALFDVNYTKDSGKLSLLMELIESGIEGGHRILVFSQFTSMLSIIEKSLLKKGIPYFYLDGKTKPEERSRMSEEFNNGKNDVFLISLKAGGMGLNLVGADMVIHYDPWWNPAVTDQASDRAYRIGQDRAVQVIRLAMRGTIEEKILKLQDTKRFLADDIIRPNNSTLKNFTDEEIMALFD